MFSFIDALILDYDLLPYFYFQLLLDIMYDRTSLPVYPLQPEPETIGLTEVYPIFFFLIVAVILSLIILGASYLFSVQKPDTEKLSIYECGFDPYEDSRNKFDVRFYIVAILFIIFDLETVLCFP